MNTFLPYADFTVSARVLDRQRLGKQRVECLQTLNVLSGIGGGWRNHPAVKMWEGYEWLLYDYAHAVIIEWNGRGYADSCWGKITDLADSHGDGWGDRFPTWLGFEPFHLSHRSNLLRKAPDYYGPLFAPDTPNDLPYYWPTEETDHVHAVR